METGSIPVSPSLAFSSPRGNPSLTELWKQAGATVAEFWTPAALRQFAALRVGKGREPAEAEAELCAAAAALGEIALLRQFAELGYHWDERTAVFAIIGELWPFYSEAHYRRSQRPVGRDAWLPPDPRSPCFAYLSSLRPHVVDAERVAAKARFVGHLNSLAPGPVAYIEEALATDRKPDVSDAELAASFGNIEALRCFREQGCPFDYTVLRAAAGLGKLAALEYLWEEVGGSRGLEKFPDQGGLRPSDEVLGAALHGGHFQVADFLIDRGANPSAPLLLSLAANTPALAYLGAKGGTWSQGLLLVTAAKGEWESLKILGGAGPSPSSAGREERRGTGSADRQRLRLKGVCAEPGDSWVRMCLDGLLTAGFSLDGLVQAVDAVLRDRGGAEYAPYREDLARAQRILRRATAKRRAT